MKEQMTNLKTYAKTQMKTKCSVNKIRGHNVKDYRVTRH